jgi:hypothetical protein
MIARHLRVASVFAVLLTSSALSAQTPTKPTITSSSPSTVTTSGSSVVHVYVVGAGLVGVTSVAVGPIAVPFRSVAPNQLELDITSSVATGPIIVRTVNGTATTKGSLEVRAAMPSASAPPVPPPPPPGPTITRVGATVMEGPQNAVRVGSQILVYGKELTTLGSATVNGVPAQFAYSQVYGALLVTVPAGATTGYVVVKDKTGKLEARSPAVVNILPAPAPSKVVPSGCSASPPKVTVLGQSGASWGGSVSVWGSNLECATVTINGMPAPAQLVVSRLVVTIPKGATTGKLVITTPSGTATTAQTLKIQ